MARTKRDHFGAGGCWGRFLGFHDHRFGWDAKPWFKPPRWFKAMRSRIRRAKDRMRLRQGRDVERWRRDDQWRWT